MRTTVIAIVLLCTAPAHAQTHPPGAVANEAKHAGWLELGIASTNYEVIDGALLDVDVSATLLMFMLGGAFRVADFIEIGGAFPFTFCDATADVSTPLGGGDEESAGFVAGNPFFRGSFLLETPRARIRAGLGVALPLAPSSDDDDDDNDEDIHIDSATLGATFAHGAFDSWLYLPDRATLVLPFRADGDAGDAVWAAEIDFGFLFDADCDEGTDCDEDAPASAPEDPDETENVMQIAGEGGFRINREMVVGGRLSLWWHLSTHDEQEAAEASDDDYDDVQAAIEPFFRMYGEDWFGSARFLINIDEPLGIFGDGQGIWGLFVVAGWRQE